jgi:Spy/CpxP family protein refolding chaperone
MKRIVVALAIMFGVFTMAAAQQETPAPGAPVPAGVPGVAPQPVYMPGHPSPVAGQEPARPVHPTPMGGQPTPRAPQPGMPDPMHDVMFPPGMILDHARQLNLTDEQKAYMRAEIQKTTTSFNELQWNLQDQMEILHEMMKASPVIEEQVLGQLNRVLDIERDIKRLHFGLAVRLKNRLTEAQQEQLQKMLMGQHMGMPGPPPPQPANPRNPENPIQ